MELAKIYRDLDDKYRCQDVIDKFTSFAQIQGTRKQYRQSLETLLPTSPIYDYLEGRISHPSYTYQRIAQITEAEEKERMNREIGERRTRLGAKISQVNIDVQREILRDSPLEDLYSSVIDWSEDDNVRRQYEEKLLQRCYDSLIILPPSQKSEKRKRVEKLARDMVIIKHPLKLAWDIAIEWKDHASLENWDVSILREYSMLFPGSGLAKVLEGFMNSEISPFPQSNNLKANIASDETSDNDGDEDDGGVKLHEPLTADDCLLLMTEGISDTNSILAHRVMGEYFIYLDEHESVVELMRNGLKLINEEAQKYGLAFNNARLSLTTLLGTSLVYYQSPRNHLEAKALFDGILADNPTSTPALIGIGLIYEEEGDFPAAIEFLERALRKSSSNIRVKSEAAWVKALNGDYRQGRHELEDCLLEIRGKDLRSHELRAQTQYRIGFCVWNIDTSILARKNRSGAYSYFLAALKSNLNYAPAYTSLGIFYSDYAKDKKRAQKCFQKAFELSASEVEAAERLARAFADQGEWDMVELVAQRVVESGKIKPSPGSKKKGISWPFAALGVAELNKQDYAKSILSFQSALRISPEDYHSWVGLGESYLNLGRYIAATKAFVYAEKFEQDAKEHKWFAKYMLANVKRNLGQYDESICGYRNVLKLRPAEFGVSISLIQTLVESAWDSVNKGLFGHAVQLAGEAIKSAESLANDHLNVFNLWKALGDACSVYSCVQSRLSNFPNDAIARILQNSNQQEAVELFIDIDTVGTGIVYAEGLYPDDEQEGLDLTRCLQAAILCYKHAIHASSLDFYAQAVAYFNLGWSEYRAHTCLSRGLKRRSTTYLRTAIRCFKRAIELEANNADFWNALGVVTSQLAPKIAQHSFVRSLFLNERSAQTWTNLGTLYLMQNDLQLANEAFTRAQSTDPDFAHAWLGQGLIALLLGDPREAKLLFTHAMDISEPSSQITREQYALSAFDHLLNVTASPSIPDLVQPIFALAQISSLASSDLSYQHLSSLFLERVCDVTGALSTLSSICNKIEADYEVTESPTSLARFSLAKVDLARSQLTAKLYNDAIENGETALQLSGEDTSDKLTFEARGKCRLSAHLTIGLAYYHSGNNHQAVESLDVALKESNGNPDCACLLAQVLWTTGIDRLRERAREILFDCVENHPGHVPSILLLGAIALLDKDIESLEAVISDLRALRTSQNRSDQEQAMIGDVLRAVTALSDADTENAVLAEVQTEVYLFPYKPHGWSRLADIGGDEYAANVALKTVMKAIPPRGNIDAIDLAHIFAGNDRVGDAQRAIMIAPWSQTGWEALGNTISR